jgi:lipoteichoic acid synthase
MFQFFRAAPKSGATSACSIAARAACFAAIFTLLYCRRIVWLSFVGGGGTFFSTVISLLAYCWQDLILLSLLLGSAWFFETRRNNWLWAAGTIALAAILMISTVSNVYAIHIVGTPLDASWLGEVNFRDAGTAWPMITAYVSGSMKRLAWVCLLGAPLLSLLSARYAVTKLAGPWALVCLAALGAFVAQINLGVSGLPVEKRLAFFNPVFGELEKLIWPARSLAYLNGEADVNRGVDRSAYALQPPRPSTFACCSGQNVVLITIDTIPEKAMAIALSPKWATRYPNLSAMSQDGISFQNFYANFPMSAQSMGAMATSLQPSFSPVLTTMEEVYDRDVDILPSVLVRDGYESAMFMGGQLKYAGAAALLKGRGLSTIEDSDSIHCGPDDEAALAIYAHLGDDCTSAAAARWIGARGRQKFFLWVWFTNPHSPYFVRARARTGGALGSRAQHMAALAETDAAIGVLRQALRQKGVLDQTLFVVVGDHGEAFGEHGQLNHGSSVFEEQVRVPLVFSGGRLGRGRREVARIGSMVDLAPSIVDAAGLTSPAGWQGRSVFAKDHPNIAYFGSRRGGRTVGFRIGDKKYLLSSVSDAIIAYDLAKDPAESTPLRLSTKQSQAAMDQISAFVAYRKALSWKPRKAR